MSSWPTAAVSKSPKRIKSDPELAATHVILLQRSVLNRDSLDLISESGCDDVLVLPMHPDDFYHHLAQVAGLPYRRNRRVRASIELSISQEDGTAAGKLINISPTGAGAEVDAALEIGPATLVLEARDDVHSIGCRVAWIHRHHANPSFFVGLDFRQIPGEARALLDQLSLFELELDPDDCSAATVYLQGDFDERTHFAALERSLRSIQRIDFNLQAVRYIGSSGVRRWCAFLREIEGKEYSFRHCSLAFASQAAMVPMLTGHGEVHSVEAPYHCAQCSRDDLRLVESALLIRVEGQIVPPLLHCSVCKGALEFDDLPERYFAFIPSLTAPQAGAPLG